MKKSLFVAALILVALGGWATAQARSNCGYRSLDVNRDHKVLASDALIVLRAAVGLPCR